MPPATFKFDDTFAFVRPVQEGRTQVAYPFITNGDRGTRTYSRTLLQREANYVPAVLGFERDSVWEGGDPAAFLIAETSPEHTGIGDLVRFTRTYARIPAQQTVYGSRMIDRPVMHDITAGGYYAVSFDNGVTSHVFSARKSVTAVGAITLATTDETITPQSLGHIEISVTGQAGTQTFYTDDSDATIQSACNTAVTGGGSNRFFITHDAYGLHIHLSPVSLVAGTNDIRVVSCSDSNIEISGSGAVGDTISIRAAKATNVVDPNTPTNIRTLTSAGHGGAAGDYLAVWNGDKLLGTTKVLAVTTDTVTIRADEAPWAVGSLAVTHLQFADTSSTRYVNGPANCTVKEVTDFYLPGVTTGITTPADITLVAPKLDPVSWLTAIQAATAYVVTEGSQLSRWLGGPIYQQTTISVQMSDALDTVAVAA